MTRRRLMVLLGILAVAGLVIGIVVSTGTRGAPHASSKSTPGKWLHPVLTALQVTTGANSYAFSYTTTFQPGSAQGAAAAITSGHGVVNLDPYAMVTTNSPESSFPNVTAEFDSTSVWEFGAGDYGTGNPPTASPGNSLSGFAGSVEGSLGQGQGALAMVSLASPTGRLNLDPNMMTNAQPVGTGSVDGVTVTNYRVSIDLSSELHQPALSEEQRTTISQALAILNRQGYSGTTEIVSIDGLGFIRETKTVATFADGGSVSSDNMISEIGCAGTVTPGDPVPTPAPPGCVSPDQPGVEPAAPTTTTTSTANTTSTTLASPTTEAPAVARCRERSDLGHERRRWFRSRAPGPGDPVHEPESRDLLADGVPRGRRTRCGRKPSRSGATNPRRLHGRASAGRHSPSDSAVDSRADGISGDRGNRRARRIGHVVPPLSRPPRHPARALGFGSGERFGPGHQPAGPPRVWPDRGPSGRAREQRQYRVNT